jgi:hypothetical protein
MILHVVYFSCRILKPGSLQNYTNLSHTLKKGLKNKSENGTDLIFLENLTFYVSTLTDNIEAAIPLIYTTA